MRPERFAGPAAIAAKGWFVAHKWLAARRAAQSIFLALFASGPLFGIWIAKGTLASSLTLDVLPLTDPLLLLQSLAAQHVPERAALVGAGIVVAGYALVGGRMFCSWVCPVNLITDLAHWLRLRLRFRNVLRLSRHLRFWLLGAVIAMSAATGSVAWESVNPVTMLHRGLLFGTLAALGLAAVVVGLVFLFDLAVAERGWCSHLCPVGAFYGLLGRYRLAKVAAPQRGRCDQCMDCYQVCPEPHVIAPALKARPDGDPVIRSIDCTNCGRCIDVCPQSVFAFTLGGKP